MQANDLERFFVERVNAVDLDGLMELYEPGAILADGTREVAIGHGQIRKFLGQYLASRPRLDPSVQATALCSGEIALTSSRLSNGDVTAEIARRQPDGSWLWVVDQFKLAGGR